MIALITMIPVPVIAIYIIFVFSLLVGGLISTFTDDDPEMRQSGAIVALTAIVWPLWIPVGLITLICHLFFVALGKD